MTLASVTMVSVVASTSRPTNSERNALPNGDQIVIGHCFLPSPARTDHGSVRGMPHAAPGKVPTTVAIAVESARRTRAVESWFRRSPRSFENQVSLR